MANQIVNDVSAAAVFHEALLCGQEECGPAVVFNKNASSKTLISFAHGQVTILSHTLKAFSFHSKDPDVSDLADALNALLEPTLSALELASTKA